MSAEDMQVPQGVFNFDFFNCEIVDNDKTGLQFGINITGVEKRTIVFKASSVCECEAWKDELNRHIENSEGRKNNKTAENISKPWRFDNITE